MVKRIRVRAHPRRIGKKKVTVRRHNRRIRRRSFGSLKGNKSTGVRTKLKLIDIEDITPIEDETLKDRDKIEEIKSSGDIRKPISVIGKEFPEEKFEVFEGRHKFVAAKERGDEKIPAIVHLPSKKIVDVDRKKKIEKTFLK